MRLTALICSRYRAFRERQKLALAPIVLVIGKNGSGKSVLTRLPLIIAQSVASNADGPIDLNSGGIQHASSFGDLVNNRSALPFSIGGEVSDGAVTYTFETTLRHINETRSLAIERFQLQKNGSDVFVADLENTDQLLAVNPVFRFVCRAVAGTAAVRFTGILPIAENLPPEAILILDTAYTAIRAACPMPSYLGPFRQEPVQSMRMPNQNIRTLGPRGESALELLADDRLRRGGALSRQVSDWFNERMGQAISVDVSGEQLRIKVVGSNGLEVGLADTGAGFSQCLPVVIQNLAFRAGRLTSPILIVEQPELHLHPGAHGAIADLIVDSSLDRGGNVGATSVVETHSEQLIMRIRRRIAERKIEKFVVLLSVGHSEPGSDEIEPVRKIMFSDTGNPDAWPTGVFEEAFRDLAAMQSGNHPG